MASAVFIVHQGKILLILRDDFDDIPYPSTWDLPGGVIEKGETHQETIKRELQEEISYVPKRLVYLGTREWPEEDLKDCLYWCEAEDHEVEKFKLGDEGQRMEWFSPVELKGIVLCPALKDYVEDLDHFFARGLLGKELPKKEDLGLEE